jgi:iron complex outermembrane recepter protein
MRLRILYFACSFFFGAFSSVGQDREITGILLDLETKEPVSYGNLRLLNSKIGTSTKPDGSFKLVLPKAQKHRLVISSLGYKTDTLAIEPSVEQCSLYLTPIVSTLNDVVVTGVSKSISADENPLSVQSISYRKIEQTVETNIIDILTKNMPGLASLKTGPNVSKPFIRGLGYNRVLTLYDGVRQEGQQWGDEHGIEVDAYSIERAEVIKGPASLTYGSDALAGVVSLFPYLPKEKDSKVHGKIISEYQSNNGLIGNGVQIGYSNKNWLWIFRSSLRRAKNYSNSVDGRVYNTGFNEQNFSGSIGYTTDKGKSTVHFTYYDNTQGIPDGSRDSLTRKFTKQIAEGALDDIKNRPLVTASELNSYQLSALHQSINHIRLYTNNHYQLGRGDLDFMLAGSQNIRQEFTHPTAPLQPGLNITLQSLNYRILYNVPSFLNLENSFGINGMIQKNKTDNATDFPIPAYDLTDGSFFFQSHWKKKNWSVLSGISFDIRNLITHDLFAKQNSITGFNEKVPATEPNAKLLHGALNQTFTGTSFNIGVANQLSDHLLLKANVGRGYRAPSISEIASNGLDPGARIVYVGNKNFVPETNLQVDLSLSLKQKSFFTSLSIFSNTIQNYIHLAQVVDAAGKPLELVQGSRTFQYQQASAHLFGLEATVSLTPEAIKGFTWTNQLALVYGNNTKREFENTGRLGQYLPFIPPPRATSQLTYEIKPKISWIKSINLSTEAEHSSTQNRYLALYETETQTTGFTLFNVGATTEIPLAKNRAIYFQLQLNNAFDIAYQSNLSRLKYFEYYNQSPTDRLGIYNMGRNLCFKIRYSF